MEHKVMVTLDDGGTQVISLDVPCEFEALRLVKRHYDFNGYAYESICVVTGEVA